MSRRIIVAMIATSLLLTVGLGEASAKKRKIARQTTIVFEDLPGSSGDRISGQVALGSPPEEPFGGEPLAAAAGGGAARCLAGQKVLVRDLIFAAAFQPLTRATTSQGTDRGNLVATATTDASGFWQTTSFEASAGNQGLFDKISVEVVKKPLKSNNPSKQTVCLGAFANQTVFSY